MNRFYDKSNKLIDQKIADSRAEWYKEGIKKENQFVEKYGEILGVAVNPAKVQDNTAPDLLVDDN